MDNDVSFTHFFFRFVEFQQCTLLSRTHQTIMAYDFSVLVRLFDGKRIVVNENKNLRQRSSDCLFSAALLLHFKRACQCE